MFLYFCKRGKKDEGTIEDQALQTDAEAKSKGIESMQYALQNKLAEGKTAKYDAVKTNGILSALK